MRLEDLIAQYRILANDKVQPYFVDDEELTLLFNEAEEEACSRSRLILKSLPPIETEEDVFDYALVNEASEIVNILYEKDNNSFGLVPISVEEAIYTKGSDWENKTGKPTHAVINGKNLRLYPKPQQAGAKIHITAYCLPNVKMESDSDEPLISQAHHRYLVQWVLFRAFAIPDAEFFDKERSEKALLDFTNYFGLPTNKDIKGDTKLNRPHVVQAFFP